ncbi:MAG: MarR family winged helix-turn-helix transcriptional regulator [Burkholderiaceae bacterium]
MERTKMAGHLIRRLQQQSTQVFQSRMQAAGFDLTSVQFAALDAIAQQPEIGQATLSAIIGFDRATIGGDRTLGSQRTDFSRDQRGRPSGTGSSFDLARSPAIAQLPPHCWKPSSWTFLVL